MKKEKDYIDEIKEWQDNQYNPGHYTGGKMPPWVTKPGNRKFLGIALLIPGTMCLIVFILVIYKSITGFSNASPNGKQDIATSIISFGIICLIAFLMIFAGVRQMRKHRSKKK